MVIEKAVETGKWGLFLCDIPEHEKDLLALLVPYPNSKRCLVGVTLFKVYDKDGKEQLVLVESDEGVDIPQETSAVTKLKEAATSLGEALKPITAVAHTVLTTLSAAVPGKITVEFGVELGGKVGIPFVTEGSGKANFKVQVTWEPTKGEVKDGTDTGQKAGAVGGQAGSSQATSKGAGS